MPKIKNKTFNENEMNNAKLKKIVLGRRNKLVRRKCNKEKLNEEEDFYSF